MKSISILLSNCSISIVVYILLVFFMSINAHEELSYDWIIMASWLGIFVMSYVLVSYYILNKTFFSLYTIFIILSFMFFYGQCFLWALGIHTEDEISKTVFYDIRITNVEIIRAQLFFLSCICAFHIAYLLIMKGAKASKKELPLVLPKDLYSKNIYHLSIILSIAVIPITFYNIINQFVTAQIYGYISLYYGDEAQKQASVLILEHLFFVCLLGLLIGSNYKKMVVLFVYIIFSLYVLIGLACGDRSGWFFTLLILLWMHHTFYRPFRKKQIIKGIFFAIAVLYLIQAIIEVRNTGINYESVSDSFSLEKNPIVSFLNEMGSSLSIIIVAINKNVVYPYGNSILLGLLAMVSMRIPALLDIDYEPITDWFSWDYLGLNYGAGFSIYAESAINFGVFLSPLFFFLIGLFVPKILNVTEKFSSLSSIKLVFMIGTSSFLISSIRNTFHDFFKYWFLGCFIFMVMIYVYQHFSFKRQNK